VGPVRHDCDVSPEELGPYLLGHLPPDEAERVRDAVQRCPVCAAEVAQLSPVVTALAAASPAVAPPPAFGPTGVDEAVLRGVLARVARERRASRRRRWAVAGVAAAVAGVLGTAGLLLTGVLGERDAGRRVQLAGGPVSGSAVLVDAEQGTRIALEVTGLAPGRYGVWLEDQEGQRVSAGSFRPDAEGGARVDLLAGLPLEDSEAIGVTVAGGEDLLREELAPGQAGTGPVGPG
jgi:anti-sigma-K factor RskA